jgi:hypothetical protein
LFRDRFARVKKGNDKGNVENLVKYIQRTILTPIPEAATWQALNVVIQDRLRLRHNDQVRGSPGTFGDRRAADLAEFLVPTLEFIGDPRLGWIDELADSGFPRRRCP